MERQDRLHALDAVRAYALLLGIAFHATISFVPTLASLGWPIADISQSDTLAGVFYVSHIFRMTTFFAIAGFFARLVVYRKGVSGFVKDRRKRILVPLLVGWPIQVILVIAAVVAGGSKANQPTTSMLPSQEHILIPFAWMHLWFLYILLLLYVVTLSVRWFANAAVDTSGRVRTLIDRGMRIFTTVPLAPLILAMPVAISLHATEWWLPWMGIPTPDNTVIPNLAAFVAYGTAFTFGWFLHRQIELLQSIERYWLGYLAAAVALSALCYDLVGMPTTPIELDPVTRVIYASAYGVASWCWTLAAIGAAIRFLSAENKNRRYLADASYWMYIMHLPLVFGLQVLMMQWPLHWSIKYVLILAITTSLLLVTYRYLVRPTFIGEMLNGRRYPYGE